MTNAEIRRPRKLEITAGLGTAAIAIGLVVLLFGFGSQSLSTVGIGYFISGLGVFVAAVCATIYLIGRP